MNEPDTNQTSSSPFAEPLSPFGEGEGQPDPDSVLWETRELLAQTKPWVRFLSILGFLVSGFAIVSFTFGMRGGGMAQSWVMLPFCLLFYVIPSLLLWNYGSRIGEYVRGRSSVSFSEALAAQRTFWKYLGIMAIILVLLYGSILAFSGLAFMMGAMK